MSAITHLSLFHSKRTNAEEQIREGPGPIHPVLSFIICFVGFTQNIVFDSPINTLYSTRRLHFLFEANFACPFAFHRSIYSRLHQICSQEEILLIIDLKE